MKTLSLIAGLVLGTGIAGVAQSSADIRTFNEKSVAVWSTGGPSMVQVLIKDTENNVVHKELLFFFLIFDIINNSIIFFLS